MKSVILFLAAAGVTVNAWAHDVTINITGSIIDSTCIVAAGSDNAVVQLGNVAAKQFTQTGDTSTKIPFTINLEKCGASTTGVAVTFVGNQDADNSSVLALDSTSDSAEGVGIAILDDTQTAVPPNTASKTYLIDGASGQTSASLAFYAQYMATRPTVTAGTANASATFTLMYP
jgi:type 1 fimbria pilin